MKSVSRGLAAKVEDLNRSNLDATKCVISYDLQSVFSLPRGNASAFYYKRKLNMFNLTATVVVAIPGIKRFTYCVVWTEAHSGRSGNDIASALIQILERLIEVYPTLKSIILWSDSCVPQNRNKINSTAIKMFLNRSGVEMIVQRYSEPGHSLIQEVDCIHSAIDKYLKNLEIHSPLHLVKLLTSMNTDKVELKIIQMLPEDFKAYSILANKMDFSKVPFSKVKILLYEKNFDFEIKFKNSAKEKEYKTVSLFKTATKGALPTPKNLLCAKLTQTFKTPISKEKKKDLKDLLPFLPEIDKQYLKTLLNI